ncbi:MAG: hypothetical protein FRX49_04988 [Trebouxia sp. A1-2]|nr:MAG: hypothetical protein FRX49_04988 [Trebouxia sp. A1-2]
MHTLTQLQQACTDSRRTKQQQQQQQQQQPPRGGRGSSRRGAGQEGAEEAPPVVVVAHEITLGDDSNRRKQLAGGMHAALPAISVFTVHIQNRSDAKIDVGNASPVTDVGDVSPVVSSSGGMWVTVPYVPVSTGSEPSVLLRPKSATLAQKPRSSASLLASRMLPPVRYATKLFRMDFERGKLKKLPVSLPPSLHHIGVGQLQSEDALNVACFQVLWSCGVPRAGLERGEVRDLSLGCEQMPQLPTMHFLSGHPSRSQPGLVLEEDVPIRGGGRLKRASFWDMGTAYGGYPAFLADCTWHIKHDCKPNLQEVYHDSASRHEDASQAKPQESPREGGYSQ